MSYLIVVNIWDGYYIQAFETCKRVQIMLFPPPPFFFVLKQVFVYKINYWEIKLLINGDIYDDGLFLRLNVPKWKKRDGKWMNWNKLYVINQQKQQQNIKIIFNML